MNELIEDTTVEDISERYQGIVRITGIRKFVELSHYARGDELYFPKVESIVSQARNRRIRKEFNGYNGKELADRYNLTIKQIEKIVKDVPVPGQMSFEDFLNAGG